MPWTLAHGQKGSSCVRVFLKCDLGFPTHLWGSGGRDLDEEGLGPAVPLRLHDLCPVTGEAGVWLEFSSKALLFLPPGQPGSGVLLVQSQLNGAALQVSCP